MQVRINKKTFISILAVAFIIILIPVSYVYIKNIGFLGKDSVAESIENIPTEEKIIKVYSNGQLLYVFEGYYSVVDHDGDFVIIKYENNQEVARMNTYGHVSVVEIPASEEVHATELLRRENE